MSCWNVQWLLTRVCTSSTGFANARCWTVPWNSRRKYWKGTENFFPEVASFLLNYCWSAMFMVRVVNHICSKMNIGHHYSVVISVGFFKFLEYSSCRLGYENCTLTVVSFALFVWSMSQHRLPCACPEQIVHKHEESIIPILIVNLAMLVFPYW